jgi:hypothetical protein
MILELHIVVHLSQDIGNDHLIRKLTGAMPCGSSANALVNKGFGISRMAGTQKSL